jgi:AraC-like DNA-binding protein
MPVAWDELSGEPAVTLGEWATRYIEQFERAHSWPAPVRAARIIRRRYRETIAVGALARELGAARSVLSREFRRAFGMSIPHYQGLCRIRAAIMRLREPSANVAAVAYAVGYKSSKNFYRALRRLTGLTPSAIQRLDEARLANLMASLNDPDFRAGVKKRCF